MTKKYKRKILLDKMIFSEEEQNSNKNENNTSKNNNNSLKHNSNSENFHILDNKYYVLNLIAEGATSKVKLAISISTGEKYAIKFLNNSSKLEIKNLKKTKEHSNSDFNFFEKEKNIYAELKAHKNVIKFIEANNGSLKKTNGKTKIVQYFVFELLQNLDLLNYILIPKVGFTEYIARNIFSQIENMARKTIH